MIGELPKSDALAEASSEALDALLTRDPFGFSKQDRTRVVEELRRRREGWQKAESFGKKKGPAASAKPKVSLDELDL